MPIITKQPEWTNLLSDEQFSGTARTQLIIGSNIYHWRKYRGLSQGELATKSSITQSIVSELEGGDYNPSIEVLGKIAFALGIKMEVLTKENFNRKFLETLDYFVSKIKNVDILKLMKLVYFTDFEYNNIFGSKLTGISYVRWFAGPFNNIIYIADDFLEKDSKGFKNRQNLVKKVALTKEEEKFLDKIVLKYGSMSSPEIRDKSYTTKPMEGCTKINYHKMGKIIL